MDGLTHNSIIDDKLQPTRILLKAGQTNIALFAYRYQLHLG